MNNLHLFATCILACLVSNAQTIVNEVIASSGEELSNSTISINSTIGELSSETLINSEVTLTQGFQQTFILLSVKVSPKVFLQGALLASSNNLMRDDLRELYVPTISPYTDALTCDVSVFLDGGTSGDGLQEDNIVDWVYIELRDKSNNILVKAETSALLQRDGDIVSTDGISTVKLNIKPDDYYLVIKHRNHLGIMSANSITFSENSMPLDFTDANNQITFGSNAQTTSGVPNGNIAMWAGDVNGDNIIQYSGTNPDTPSILSNVLNDSGNFLNFPTYTVSGYNDNDVDMNGKTQYSGTEPDSPFILQNILAHPGNFLNFSTFSIQEQIPQN